MSPFNLYLLFTLPKIGLFLISAGVVAGVFFFVAMLVDLCMEEEWTAYCSKMFRWLMIMTIVIFTGILFPCTKQMVAIFAIPAVVNNERVMDMGEKSMDIVEAQLEDWLNIVKGTVPEKETND